MHNRPPFGYRDHIAVQSRPTLRGLDTATVSTLDYDQRDAFGCSIDAQKIRLGYRILSDIIGYYRVLSGIIRYKNRVSPIINEV